MAFFSRSRKYYFLGIKFSIHTGHCNTRYHKVQYFCPSIIFSVHGSMPNHLIFNSYERFPPPWWSSTVEWAVCSYPFYPGESLISVQTHQKINWGLQNWRIARICSFPKKKTFYSPPIAINMVLTHQCMWQVVRVISKIQSPHSGFRTQAIASSSTSLQLQLRSGRYWNAYNFHWIVHVKTYISMHYLHLCQHVRFSKYTLG